MLGTRSVIAFILLIISTSVAGATGVGFLSGNNFSSSVISGQVTVNCADGTTSQYTCRDIALDPVIYDYFVGTQGVDADEVNLDNLCPDGSHRNRGADYNASEGRSQTAFNLSISTLFQRPLLQMGLNKMTYTLLKNNKKVSQGSFDVKVVAGVPRTCPATHYNSVDPGDCQSQYSVCQRYFEQYQFCR